MLFRYLALPLLGLFTLWLFISATVLDMGIWVRWGASVDAHGWIKGYALNAHEHPPLLSLLFWLAAEAGSLLGLPVEFGLKLSFLLFLLGATALVYRWSSHHKPFTCFFYIVFAVTSLGLCYMDLYFGLPLLLAFWCFSRQYVAAGVACFTLAVLVKYPPLVIAPFVAIYLLTHCRGRLLLTQVLLPALTLTLPFLFAFNNELLESLRRALGQHHGWLNAHGLNLMYLLSYSINPAVGIIPQQDAATLPWIAPLFYPKLWILLFYVPVLFSFAWHDQTLSRLLQCAIVGHLCYFTLNTCVHENHLLPSALLAAALFCTDSRHRPLAVLLIAMAFLNLVVFFGFRGYPFLPLEQVKLLLAAFNVCVFLYLWTRVTFFPEPSIPEPSPRSFP